MLHHKKIKADLPVKCIEHDLEDRRVLMQACGVRKAFDGNKVLKDVSFDLKEGEVVLLRGDNGSGKTTLLNILTGNMEPDEGVIHLDIDEASETFGFPRRWWQNLNPFDPFTPERVANEAVGRTWQGVRLFSTQSLIDNIAVATVSQPGENPVRTILFRRQSQDFEKHNREKSSELLSGLGLKDRVNSSAENISLGQTKRVAIARAVRAGARILFLDEPLAGLDEKGIEDIMILLTDLAHNNKITLVIIEHIFNIPRVLGLAHTVWTLCDGSITVESPDSVYTEMQRTAGDSVVALLKSIAGIDTTAIEQELPGSAMFTRFQQPKIDSQQSEKVLEIKDLVVRRGPRLIIGHESSDGTITGLSLTVQAGDLAVLQAPNGWGKTTLLEAIAGIIPVEQGEIYLLGNAIHNLPTWKRIQLGLTVLQARDHHFDNLTVDETFSLSHIQNNKRMPDSLKLYGKRRLSSLSGGESQYVSIEVLRKAIIGLYDEPFYGLDLSTLKSVIFTMLRHLNDTNIILIPYSI